MGDDHHDDTGDDAPEGGGEETDHQPLERIEPPIHRQEAFVHLGPQSVIPSFDFGPQSVISGFDDGPQGVIPGFDFGTQGVIPGFDDGPQSIIASFDVGPQASDLAPYFADVGFDAVEALVDLRKAAVDAFRELVYALFGAGLGHRLHG
ncbi:MAG TPA: hypothetical protein VH299_04265 [Solirubrobacterales bacterium]|jgi:hypothetical protein|nr:hypothetical protein [Solirubrobacterales bacterium]